MPTEGLTGGHRPLRRYLFGKLFQAFVLKLSLLFLQQLTNLARLPIEEQIRLGNYMPYTATAAQSATNDCPTLQLPQSSRRERASESQIEDAPATTNDPIVSRAWPLNTKHQAPTRQLCLDNRERAIDLLATSTSTLQIPP